MDNKSFKLIQCSVFTKLDGDKSSEFGLLGGNPIISYYESILSPSINLTIDTLKLNEYLKRISIIRNGKCINKKTKRIIKAIKGINLFSIIFYIFC